MLKNKFFLYFEDYKMPVARTCIFSITIRPRSCPPLEHVIPFFRKWSSKCIVAIEDGGSHFQCGMVRKTYARAPDVKKELLRLFPDLSDEEKKIGICVKAHKSWDYLLGYCLKEVGDRQLGVNLPFIFNISEDEIAKATQSRQSHESYRQALSDQKVVERWSLNTFTDNLVEWLHERGKHCDNITEYDVKMYLNLVHERVSYSVWSKIRMETLVEWLIESFPRV